MVNFSFLWPFLIRLYGTWFQLKLFDRKLLGLQQIVVLNRFLGIFFCTKIPNCRRVGYIDEKRTHFTILSSPSPLRLSSQIFQRLK